MGPEARTQAAVVKWAREKYPYGLLARKTQVGRFGSNGWPDYEFNGRTKSEKPITFFIEFKAPNGRVTAIQAQRHADLRELGFRVYVVADAETGKRIIYSEMEEL